MEGARGLYRAAGLGSINTDCGQDCAGQAGAGLLTVLCSSRHGRPSWAATQVLGGLSLGLLPPVTREHRLCRRPNSLRVPASGTGAGEGRASYSRDEAGT